MVASGFIVMHHIPSKDNLADVLTKHWGDRSVWDLIQPVFNWMGNTADLYEDDDPMCLDDFFTKVLDGDKIDSVLSDQIIS